MNTEINIYDTDIKSYCAESDDGNIEYKYKLVDLNEDTLSKRTTQMKFRINEGNGEAFYYIGIMDQGLALGISELEYIESINNLNKIALKLNCSVTKLYELIKNNLYIGEFLIREIDNNQYIDVKISVVGNVDSGKSTTIGTLTKGILDDGRGRSRLHVFNFKHEIDSGRTSSIGHQILGFDSNGKIVNEKFDRNSGWTNIVAKSKKIISFFDLAGHEKYLQTTIYGLTSFYPDYCLIMIGANTGINHMTREHMGLCLTLKIPFIIIISKMDIAPANIIEENMKKIYNICKNGARKIPYNIKSKEDVISAVKKIKSDNIIPIIQISNVSGYNLDLLKCMLNILPIRNDYTAFIDKPIEFLIDNTYSSIGHSTIVSGLLTSGTMKVNDIIALGPFFDGSYKQCKIRSIHCKFKDIKEAKAGTYICISLKNIIRKEIKKGMVLVTDINTCKIAQKEFWANIYILHSPTTIKIGYQPFVHIDQVRQCVRIIKIVKINKDTQQDENQFKTITRITKILNSNTIDIQQEKIDTKSLNNKYFSKQIQETDETDQNILRSGDKAYVKLEFIKKPEYIKPMMKLIFREGKVRAVGKII
jgi:GTPase